MWRPSPPSLYKAGRDAPGWFVSLVTPRLPEIELKTHGGDRIVVSPDASRAILDGWDDLRGLLWLMLVFLVLLNAVVFLLLGRALRPVKSILTGLSEMERGSLHVRMPALRSPEFDAIGHSFNRMAAALEQSLSIMFPGRRLTDLSLAERGRLLTAMRNGAAPGAAWRRMSSQEFYRTLRADVCFVYMTDPEVCRRIGFPGPSTSTGGYPDFDRPQA